MSEDKTISQVTSRVVMIVVKGAAVVASISIFVMMISTIADVTARFLLNKAIPGVVELCEFLMVMVVFLGLAYTQVKRGHVRAEVFINKISPRHQIAVELFGYLLALPFFVMFAYQAGLFAYEAWKTGEFMFGLMRFPTWPSKIFVCVGLFVLCLQLLADSLLIISRLGGRKNRTFL